MIGSDLVGKRLTRVRRAFYEFQGAVERDEGLVELSFADGTSVYLDVGPDGESLRAEMGPWVDPFAPPHDVENEEYIRLHGKYSAFDVSGESPYREAVGHQVRNVRPMVDEDTSKQCGLVLEFEGIGFKVEVVADELYVTPVDGYQHNSVTF
ncbi:hypothetical protein GCM10010116_61390 [Microbispora rosea subsp. aerata]|nr:hypothetical protein [Microbispora rosea]GGO30666.1 hypothetical protein GCM10010116_61390 [Microbispora rosea subsp. aerata]GIH59116.1 hypothetical protein Mro02_60300 [Microbispora rosea subsp. aerata]GLJ82720.1 hypothetical protein GCM10017588_14450 [Microbispora rosea subsp. aerata]